MATVMRCFENGRVVLAYLSPITLFRQMTGDKDATHAQLEDAVESGEYAYCELEYCPGSSIDLDTAIGL